MVFGRLESEGEARAVFHRTPRGRLTLAAPSAGQADALATPSAGQADALATPSAGQADVLAAHLAGLDHTFSGVTSDHDTATAFTEA